MKRGWYIGSPEFMQRLTDELNRLGKRGDKTRGAQRSDHGEREAERLLEKALRELGIKELELLESKNTRLEKQGVAWLLNAHTTATVRWTANRLEFGAAVNASRGINRFRRAKEREVRGLRSRLEKVL